MSKKDAPADSGTAEVRPDAPPALQEQPAEQKAAEQKADDGKRTPDAWAKELGHVDEPVREGAKRPIKRAKGYIFAAVCAHCGWGKQRAADERITRAEYEEAVAEAMGTTLGGGVKGSPLRWRHDVRDAKKKEA